MGCSPSKFKTGPLAAQPPPAAAFNRRRLSIGMADVHEDAAAKASEAADGSVAMTFRLAEGVCRTSLALNVARSAGLPALSGGGRTGRAVVGRLGGGCGRGG